MTCSTSRRSPAHTRVCTRARVPGEWVREYGRARGIQANCRRARSSRLAASSTHPRRASRLVVSPRQRRRSSPAPSRFAERASASRHTHAYIHCPNHPSFTRRARYSVTWRCATSSPPPPSSSSAAAEAALRARRDDDESSRFFFVRVLLTPPPRGCCCCFLRPPLPLVRVVPRRLAAAARAPRERIVPARRRAALRDAMSACWVSPRVASVSISSSSS